MEISAGSLDNENRKNKTLLTRGAFDSLLRGHSWLSGESPPQKYCECYSLSGARGASWKQSRELSSSGQRGLAARALRPGAWGETAKSTAWKLLSCMLGPGDGTAGGEGLIRRPEAELCVPFAALKRNGTIISFILSFFFFGAWGVITARKGLRKAGTEKKRCRAWGRCTKIPAIPRCFVFCLEGSESKFGV